MHFSLKFMSTFGTCFKSAHYDRCALIESGEEMKHEFGTDESVCKDMFSLRRGRVYNCSVGYYFILLYMLVARFFRFFVNYNVNCHLNVILVLNVK